ncbi:MAG: hypothetical protein KKH94_02385 [Candidatus Omnitrophica bacterium]|nr:hypothetical protein [Candidatus Omnitrophota bacterium]
MKILKIEDNKGLFSFDGSKWTPIDEMDKEHLMNLVNLVLTSSIEMDEYNETNIGNQAHQIIYKSIYEKFITLQSNKEKFKDESERTYLEAIEKYQKYEK